VLVGISWGEMAARYNLHIGRQPSIPVVAKGPSP
jgi:hypothetical protein